MTRLDRQPPLLEARDLGRRDGSGRAWLIQGVSLAVQAGSRLGLTGPSGGGKTVLLRALAALDPLSEGELDWQGRSVHGPAAPVFRAHVIYLHQRPAFVEGTVEANLRLPFSLRQHCDKQFDRDRVCGWLAALERDERFLAKGVHDLSGGESQLAGLLRAMQLDPQILLLDEPTAALDRHTASLVERLVAAWLADRPSERAFVWVSHDMDQAERMADSIVRINSGRIER